MEVVGGLQAECDVAGARLLGRYQEVRRTAGVVREAQARRGKGAGGLAFCDACTSGASVAPVLPRGKI